MQSDFLLNYERPFIYHLSRALTNNAYTKHLTERICEDLNKTNTDIFRNCGAVILIFYNMGFILKNPFS